MTDSERYVAMVRAMGEAANHARGWQSAAARTLGVHASLINRIANGKPVRVGDALIGRAVSRGLLDAPVDTHAFRVNGPVITAAERSKSVRHADPEVTAMEALARLDDGARERVLRWATERWGMAEAGDGEA